MKRKLKGSEKKSPIDGRVLYSCKELPLDGGDREGGTNQKSKGFEERGRKTYGIGSGLRKSNKNELENIHFSPWWKENVYEGQGP